MQPQDLSHLAALPDTDPLPVLFVGHGSPMNAIEDNEFSAAWRQLGQTLPRPAAILCVSAHWETWGTLVTAMGHPRTIHDFGGFPRALFAVEYPAPGSPQLAQAAQEMLQPVKVGFDADWGLDHGAWSVLRQMYPAADVPIVQLSLDYTQPARSHYEVGRRLAPLRRKGILIVGSGNMVHNLRRVMIRSGNFSDFNQPFGFDWAIEANELFKKHINEGNHGPLLEYQTLGPAVQLAVPTPEHYLPMLYALALQEPHDSLTYFNDKPLAGSLTMTSFVIGRAA